MKGSKGVEDALSKLGISKEKIQDAGTLTERLLLVADGLSKVDDAASRAALADKLGVRELLPLLQQGRKGVEDLTGAYTDLGKTADDSVKRIGGLGDKIADLKKALAEKSDNLFVRLAPVIAGVYQQISDLLSLADDPRWKFIWGMTPLGATSTFAEGLNFDTASHDVPGARPSIKAALEEWKKTHPAPKAPDEPTGGGDPVAEAAAKSAEKARLAYEKLATARRDWRSDPTEKAATRDSLEAVSEHSTATMEGRNLQALSDQNDATQRAREAWHYAFRGFIEDLKSGDIQGAFVNLFDGITQRMTDKASDWLADKVFDWIGGDVMTPLFDPLTTAQQAQAVAVDTTSTSMQALTVAANQAASALASMAGGGGGGGGAAGWGKILGSLFGSVIGASAGAASGSVAAGIGSVAGFLASGGPVTAGALYGINERGAEPFIPAVNGRILSVPQAQAAMRGGGGPTYQVTIDARGATKDAIPGIQAAVAQLQRHAAGERGRIINTVNDASSRRLVR